MMDLVPTETFPYSWLDPVYKLVQNTLSTFKPQLFEQKYRINCYFAENIIIIYILILNSEYN